MQDALVLCQLCLQDLHERGIIKIPRTENEADVLTQFSMCCGTSIVSRKVKFLCELSCAGDVATLVRKIVA